MTEKEYIERKALLNKLSEIPVLKDNSHLMALCKKWANAVPAADVRENIKTEWGPDHATALCRNCGTLFPAFLRMKNFCPNCGADMRGE